MNTAVIISIVVLFAICIYVIINLFNKVSFYEDVLSEQVGYLRSLHAYINTSKKHLESLDEKGFFRSDDEIGYFFNSMKEVQEGLNRYMLPETYGKETDEQ